MTVHHKNPQVFTDLRRRQTAAIGVIHRIDHVRRQPPHAVIQRRIHCNPPQRGVAIDADRQNAHPRARSRFSFFIFCVII